MRQDFDLVVVGAGLLGTLVAYLACRRRPERSVLLLDRSQAGRGATCQSIGLMPAIAATLAQVPLVARSARLLQEIAAAGVPVPVSAVPALWIVPHAARDRLEERLRRPLCAAPPDACVEPLSLPGTEVALRDEPIPVLDARRLVGELLGRLRAGGACQCWEGVGVRDTVAVNGGWRVETLDGRAIRSRQVVIATGPWMLDGPFADRAARAGLRLKKVVALHVERTPPEGQPLLLFPERDAFLLPTGDRRWVLSIRSGGWDCRPEPSRLHVDAAERDAGLAVLSRYLPSLVAACVGGRAHCDGYTPTRVPLVAGAAPGLVLCGGGSGGGVRMGPAAAETALDWLEPSPARRWRC